MERVPGTRAIKLTNEEYARLEGMGDFANDKELVAALEGDADEIASETSTALGAGFQIGDQELPPVHFGTLAHLEAIGSPLLDPEQLTYELRDVMIAVYVMFKGRDAVKTVAHLNRVKAAVAKHLPDPAAMSAQHYELAYGVFLHKIEQAELAWAQIEDKATAFWDEVGATDVQAVVDTIIEALNHAAGGFVAVSGGGSGNAKKNGSTASGWARLWRCFARLLRLHRRV